MLEATFSVLGLAMPRNLSLGACAMPLLALQTGV
jgi:hypothetical protein